MLALIREAPALRSAPLARARLTPVAPCCRQWVVWLKSSWSSDRSLTEVGGQGLSDPLARV